MRPVNSATDIPSDPTYRTRPDAGDRPSQDTANEKAWPSNYEPIVRFFDSSHLPLHLQRIALPFAQLAEQMLLLPPSAERAAGLRKLLEAKDCAVRAAL